MSIRELARLAGISSGAVSLALRDSPKISPATKRRVAQLAHRHGYHVNARVAELMAYVRSGQPKGNEACLGVISFYDSLRPWEPSRHLQRIYEGMTKRAGELGYRLEPLWLRAPGMTYPRFRAILEARGIEGLLCFGSPDLEETFPAELGHCAIVTVGLSIKTPLHRVTSHFYNDMTQALKRAHDLGYRRPGLVIGRYEEARSAHAYVSAYLGWCDGAMGPAAGLPILRLDRVEEAPLAEWLGRHRPDAVIFVHLYDAVEEFKAFLRKRRIRVPGDLGVLVISQLVEGTGFPGLQQNQQLMGAWAVELLVARIMNRDMGIPSNPRIEMVESQWTREKARAPRVPA